MCSYVRRLPILLLLTFRISSWAQNDALAEQSHHAKELMAAGRFEDAIPIYQQLVKAVPGNLGLILNLGLAEEFAGHPNLAIPRFEIVLKAQPDNIPALTSIAMARLQMQQPGPAIAPLRKLTSLQPDNRDACGMLAGALLDTNHPEEAAAEYRKLSASDKTDTKAWYGLGSAYEAAANTAFERLTKLALESPYWAALVAETRLQTGQYRSAFFFYKRAVDALPDLRGIHSELAQVYRKTGHEDWATSEEQREANLAAKPCTTKTAECSFASGKFLEAAQANSTQPESLFWKIKALNSLALEAFAQLSALPESPELHALKAGILKGRKQYKEAAEEWQAALKLSPKDGHLYHELLTSLFLAHGYDTLMPMLKEALQNEPRSADLNFMLGASLLQTQQPEKAIPYLEAALKADSGLLPAHASLGFALSQVNRANEAIPHLQRALEIDDDGSLHYQLARVYQSAGNAARAKELMAQYQSITAKTESAKEEVAKQAEIVAPAP